MRKTILSLLSPDQSKGRANRSTLSPASSNPKGQLAINVGFDIVQLAIRAHRQLVIKDGHIHG
jgi:hypothetical protein